MNPSQQQQRQLEDEDEEKSSTNAAVKQQVSGASRAPADTVTAMRPALSDETPGKM